MTAAAAPFPTFSPAQVDPLATSLLARWSIGLIAFTGAFMINEPAPYELLLLVVMVMFLLFGMRLSGHALYLGILMIIFNIGGMLSMFTMADYKEIPLYLAVSLFLGLSSVFWAAAIENNVGRLRILMRGYVIGAAITSMLGIAGYFGAFPGAELFTLYDRAKGAFHEALRLLVGPASINAACPPSQLFDPKSKELRRLESSDPALYCQNWCRSVWRVKNRGEPQNGEARPFS